jgi:hypothetical protein
MVQFRQEKDNGPFGSPRCRNMALNMCGKTPQPFLQTSDLLIQMNDMMHGRKD